MKRVSQFFFLTFLSFFSMASAQEEKFHEVKVEVQLVCPMSDELESFIRSIPPEGSTAKDYSEWRDSFVENMTKLIQLVESGKVHDAVWSAGAQGEPIN